MYLNTQLVHITLLTVGDNILGNQVATLLSSHYIHHASSRLIGQQTADSLLTDRCILTLKLLVLCEHLYWADRRVSYIQKLPKQLYSASNIVNARQSDNLNYPSSLYPSSSLPLSLQSQ